MSRFKDLPSVGDSYDINPVSPISEACGYNPLLSGALTLVLLMGLAGADVSSVRAGGTGEIVCRNGQNLELPTLDAEKLVLLGLASPGQCPPPPAPWPVWRGGQRDHNGSGGGQPGGGGLDSIPPVCPPLPHPDDAC